ncbi:hypothetical protein NQ314_012290 [Rhamnusium bicolor]|uniref:Peptidase M13 C-terminal domain-containing protein n=1 Tax=Rhamnusium bicolor TaxID=1586634 RepID=A0AAV8XCY5_9CUCU|nr:hypothetical protein NQ314_012290 [Rhamnusium bicolor]
MEKNGSMFEENLADFSGVNFAYRAYQNWVSKNGHENSLPGIKYTPNQLFWIMTSTYLCYGPRLEEKNEATTNVLKKHGVPSFRVIGPLRNSPYFAHDFNCPVGSSMNPKNKCRIFT